MEIQKTDDNNIKIIERDEYWCFKPRITLEDSNIKELLKNIWYDSLKKFKENSNEGYEEDTFEENNSDYYENYDEKRFEMNKEGNIENKDSFFEPEGILKNFKKYIEAKKYIIYSIISILIFLFWVIIFSNLKTQNKVVAYNNLSNKKIYEKIKKLENKKTNISVEIKKLENKIDINNYKRLNKDLKKYLIKNLDKKLNKNE